MANKTDHSTQIEKLRIRGTLENRLAADLLELHDRTSLSLDKWETARKFVERRIGGTIQENGV